MRIFVFILILGSLSHQSYSQESLAKQSLVRVWFSPDGGAAKAIVGVLGQAKKSVFVHAYLLTNKSIVESLVEARFRGVNVAIIMDGDKPNNKEAAEFLVANGVSVYLDDRRGESHNKVMILDEELVITGSYNFTNSAEKLNTENLVMIANRDIASQFKNNWLDNVKKCRPMQVQQQNVPQQRPNYIPIR